MAFQTWYLLREVLEVLVVLLTGLLERLERLSSISASELVAELTVDTETLPLLPSLLLQSLISDFLKSTQCQDKTMTRQSHLTETISHQLVDNNETHFSYLTWGGCGGGGVIRGAGQVWHHN